MNETNIDRGVIAVADQNRFDIFSHLGFCKVTPSHSLVSLRLFSKMQDWRTINSDPKRGQGQIKRVGQDRARDGSGDNHMMDPVCICTCRRE